MAGKDGNGPRIDRSGAVITQERERAGATLPALADRLGWHKSRLFRYENNDTPLTAEAIVEIADALGIKPEYLLLRCVEVRFPKLADRRTDVGKAAGELLDSLKGLRPKRKPE